jgi:hypothetical protein
MPVLQLITLTRREFLKFHLATKTSGESQHVVRRRNLLNKTFQALAKSQVKQSRDRHLLISRRRSRLSIFSDSAFTGLFAGIFSSSRVLFCFSVSLVVLLRPDVFFFRCPDNRQSINFRFLVFFCFLFKVINTRKQK